MPISPDPSYTLAAEAFAMFPHWLAQQQIPSDTPEWVLHSLESAFMAGYMRND